MVAGVTKSQHASHGWTDPLAGGPLVAATVLVAVDTVFMLQAMRVFVSYLVFVIDQSNRAALGVVTVGVFLSIALMPLLIRTIGVRGTLVATGLTLVLLRLGLQFWSLPEARVVLGAGIIIVWGWLIITFLARMRAAVAVGLVLALALDLVVRIAFRTLDLPWMPGLSAHAVTLALAAVMLAGLWRLTRGDIKAATFASGSPAVVAIGPVIVLFHLVSGNLGLAQVKTGLDFPAAAAVLSAGMLISFGGVALLILPRSSKLRTHRLFFPVLIFVGSLALVIFWLNETLAPLGLLVGASAILTLLACLLLPDAAMEELTSLSRITAWFTLGMLVQVVILFAYYTFSGAPVLILVAGAVFARGVLAGLFREGPRQTTPVASNVWLMAVMAVLLIACTGWRLLSRDEPSGGDLLGQDLTVMTYNIQTGFSIDNYWSLERTAQTIEAAEPDIVVLQEISRGWLVTTGVDQVLWLGQRLDMHLFFGGNSDDRLWGNAILSRAPLHDSEHHQFRETQNLKRGMVGAWVETEAGPLWIFGTHLDNPVGAGIVRLAQVEQLLGAWENRAPAILLGDLNAEPEDDVLARLAEAGFLDLGTSLGPDGVTSEDGRRIDYILGTSEISIRSIEIPNSRASDHKPVVAEITLNP